MLVRSYVRTAVRTYVQGYRMVHVFHLPGSKLPSMLRLRAMQVAKQTYVTSYKCKNYAACCIVAWYKLVQVVRDSYKFVQACTSTSSYLYDSYNLYETRTSLYELVQVQDLYIQLCTRTTRSTSYVRLPSGALTRELHRTRAFT